MMLAMVSLPSAIFVMRAETFPNAVIGAPLCCGAQRAASRDGSRSDVTRCARHEPGRGSMSAVVFLVALREPTRPPRVLLDRRQCLIEGRVGSQYEIGTGL